MNSITTAAAPSLAIIDGKAITTSNSIALSFSKRHDNVLQSIASAIAECPKEFTALNFQVSEFTDSTGRKLPAYAITRDGFTLLAMGFTGKRALTFKLAYIQAFNRMEAALVQPRPAVPFWADFLDDFSRLDGDNRRHIRFYTMGLLAGQRSASRGCL